MAQNLLEQHVRAVKDLAPDFGVAEVDTTGMELAHLVRMVSNLYQAIGDEHLQDSEVSGPRWGLLLRLRREELHGDLDGCSPTHLSRCQSVSKNTISALVRGLEEQGLIERALDPEDRRGFRIRLSDAGRRLVADTAPLHLRYLNELVAGLAPDEQAQLAALLQKLYRALASHARKPNDASPLANASSLADANALARPFGHSPAG
jgi:DNA-binding MarR family transcriptional regulator